MRVETIRERRSKRGRDGRILTFYSYKGGTGRSMALANIAWILASNGRRVLTIDWDLEAPGLHRYFRPLLMDEELKSSPGLIDFFIDYTTTALSDTPDESDSDGLWVDQAADVLPYIASLDWRFPEGGTVDLMPAGLQNQSYADRVNSFDWSSFYTRLGGARLLEAVKKLLRFEYDYILIDSRTGVSDTSGICTVAMPDRLLVFFTLNRQSIEGTASVSESVQAQFADEPIQIFPIITRVEGAEKDLRDAMRHYAWKRFEKVAAPALEGKSYDPSVFWSETEIPYEPYYAYQETLSTFRDDPDDPKSLLAAHQRVTAYVTDGQVTRFSPTIERERTHMFLPVPSIRPQPLDSIDDIVRENPRLFKIADVVRKGVDNWERYGRSRTGLLPAQGIERLEDEPELLSAFLSEPGFLEYWDQSIIESKRRGLSSRRLTLATGAGVPILVTSGLFLAWRYGVPTLWLAGLAGALGASAIAAFAMRFFEGDEDDYLKIRIDLSTTFPVAGATFALGMFGLLELTLPLLPEVISVADWIKIAASAFPALLAPRLVWLLRTWSERRRAFDFADFE